MRKPNFLSREQLEKLTKARIRAYWKRLLCYPEKTEVESDDSLDYVIKLGMAKDNPIWIEHHKLVTEIMATKN